MKTPLVIALSALIVTQCCARSYITVIGPRTAASGSTYKAFINAQNLMPFETLVVALKSQNKVHDTKKLTGLENVNEEIELKLPSDPHDSYNLLSLFVTKTSRGQNICFIKEAKIFSSSSMNLLNLIQMDKPVYKPGEKLRFRILTLDHQTKPYKYNTIKVDIVDASGVTVQTFSEGRKSDFGFYENSFTISEEPIQGVWTLKVEIDGSEVKSSKTFVVKDIKPAPFNVFVETAPRVSIEGYNPSINLKIYAKYSFDKFVKGNAKITAKTYNKDLPGQVLSEHSRDVFIDGGSLNVKFDLKKDLSMEFVTKTMDVEFKVEFIEDQLNRKAEQSERVEVLPSGNNYIKLTKPEFFKPGFVYKIKAEVFTLDGTPDERTSIPIIMKYKFNYKEKSVQSAEVDYPQFLKDGKTYFLVNTTDDVQNFTASFEFEGAKVEEFIDSKRANGDEVLQITYEPEYPAINQTVKVHVQSNSLMNTLNVLVFSRNGLIHSQNFDDSQDSEEFLFDLEVTKEMAPEATVIVFYTREQDGEIVYDQFKLELGFMSENKFTITPQAESYKPKETASFALETQSKSFVGLLGIDQSIKNLGINNQMTTQDINTKLTSLGKLKTDKYNGKFYLDLAKSNVFVLQPLKSTRHKCKPSEEKYLTDSEASTLEVLSGEGIDDEVAEWEYLDSTEVSNPADDLVRKYLPDVWMFDFFEAQEPSLLYPKDIPDKITTWMLSGFSIHPEHGLAIAEPQSIKVYQDFFIKVEIPSSVKVGEILKIDVTVHNYLPRNQNAEIKLQADGFVLVKERSGSSVCKQYNHHNEKVKRLVVNPQSGATIDFLLLAVKSGSFVIKVEAAGQDASDFTEKTVKVEYEGVTQYKSYPVLIDLKTAERFNKDILIDIPNDVDPNTVKIEASLSGNLLGPAMVNIKRLITIPAGSGESKMKSFVLAIYTYKYLKSLNLENSKLMENALNAMQKGYQDARALQLSNGAFKLWNKDESSQSIWLTAYVTQLLGDAREFIEIDEAFYENSLEYLKSKRKTDGSFIEDGVNPRINQGGQPGKIVYLTSFVMIAVAKNKKTYEDFSFINDEAAGYLKSSNIYQFYDYEKAIVAYALAMSEETKKAKEVISSLAWAFEKFSKSSIKALQIEIASYIILASLKLERYNDAKRAFNWLIDQRKPHGGFFSTYDTVIGLEALAAYQEYLGSYETSTDITFTPGNAKKIESQTDSKIIELPSTSRRFSVSAIGRGLAYVNIFYQYKTKLTPAKQSILLFVQSEETNDGVKINFKVGYKGATNTAIVEVQLPSGFEYNSGKFSDDVKKIVLNEDKSKVFFYFDSITGPLYSKNQSIEAVKIAEVKNIKQAYVRAYDYYEPEYLSAIFYYDVNSKDTKCSTPAFDTPQKPIIHTPLTTKASETTQKIDVRLNNKVEDELHDVRVAATVYEKLYEGRIQKRGAGSVIKNKIVITAPLQFYDKNRLEVYAFGKNSQNDQFNLYSYNVDSVRTENEFNVLYLNRENLGLPDLDIAAYTVNIYSLDCYTTILDAQNNPIKRSVKLFSQWDCWNALRQNHRICTFDTFDAINKGNPLICKLDGKLLQIGLGIGVTQQGIAYYIDLRGYRNSILYPNQN